MVLEKDNTVNEPMPIFFPPEFFIPKNKKNIPLNQPRQFNYMTRKPITHPAIQFKMFRK
jgi:hypothetical protein